ncbi:unnamed protein product [Blepharisma stoltei]|uniref:Cyclic nucleotide-binding domain-containing protein n=1 Tax=Blepharisma stoltei TaxID=1481888 RepID=A0AAU9JCZ1_9CILI|nr:unnamed protein product [Blepharisma stoltei]
MSRVKIIPLLTECPTVPTENYDLDGLLSGEISMKNRSPVNQSWFKNPSFTNTNSNVTPWYSSHAKKLWQRAFFIIRIQRILEKFKRELMLFGTSNEVFDQDKKFKQNLDSILQKKVDKEEDFRVKKWDRDEKLIPWYIIDPDGKFKRSWDMILTLFLLYTAIVMPFRLAFAELKFFDVWTTIEIMIDLLFIIDMCFSFISGVHSYEGTLHADIKYIIWHYLKTWFIIDAVSSVPYTLIDYWMGGGGNTTRSNNLAKLLRIPRLYKLLRVIRIAKALKHYKKHDLADKIQDMMQLNSRFYKLMTFLVSVCLCVHIMGCLWFFMAKINNFDPDTWVTRCGYIDKTVWEKYIASIYWAMTTVTTVGYGDIAARTELEQLLAMIWMLIGIGFYSFTIGALSSFLSEIDTKESILAAKLAAIHEFANETGISAENKSKIREIIKYNTSKVGTVWSDKHSLFKELPKSLRYEVSATMYSGIVKDLIFFRDQDPSFIISIMPLLKPLQHKDCDFLYREGTFPDEVFFIVKGRVNLVLENNGICYKSFLKGSYIGEIEILTKRSIRDNNAQAAGLSEFLVISKHDFLKILKDFPDQQKKLTKIAKERWLRNTKAKEELSALINLGRAEGIPRHLETKGNFNHRKSRRVSTVVVRDRLGMFEDTIQANSDSFNHLKARISSIENGVNSLLKSLKPTKQKMKTALGVISMKYT